jgi:hypothetical protein
LFFVVFESLVSPSVLMNQNERTLAYDHRTIVYSCSGDTIPFIATAAITWTTSSGTVITFFLRSTQLYPSKEDATTAALREAKMWVDSHPRF